MFENELPDVRTIESGIEQHVRFSGGLDSKVPNKPMGAAAEDMRDKQYDRHLELFYSQVNH